MLLTAARNHGSELLLKSTPEKPRRSENQRLPPAARRCRDPPGKHRSCARRTIQPSFLSTRLGQISRSGRHCERSLARGRKSRSDRPARSLAAAKLRSTLSLSRRPRRRGGGETTCRQAPVNTFRGIFCRDFCPPRRPLSATSGRRPEALFYDSRSTFRAAGSSIVTASPPSPDRAARTEPEQASTAERTMASPRPTPPASRVRAESGR